MNAKKCDRCGIYYMPDNTERDWLVVKRYEHPFGFTDTKDLCPGCYDKLLDFLEPIYKEVKTK